VTVAYVEDLANPRRSAQTCPADLDPSALELFYCLRETAFEAVGQDAEVLREPGREKIDLEARDLVGEQSEAEQHLQRVTTMIRGRRDPLPQRRFSRVVVCGFRGIASLTGSLIKHGLTRASGHR